MERAKPVTDTSHYRLKGALQKTMADSAAETPADAAPAPAAAQDLYAVLGCAKGDDAPVITKRYRKLALRYHPDRNRGDGQAESRSGEITMDPSNRPTPPAPMT